MAPSFWQILIVVALVVLLFGSGKISGLMGDVAKGIKSFRKGLKDEEEPGQERRTLDHAPAQPHDAASAAHKQETPRA
jgi:sec-independent protein translocase protein TatA